MGFDVSNRLFLILVEEQDFGSSWKLKRNVELLTKAIAAYVDDFDVAKVGSRKITFSHKARSGVFEATADAIFVVR